MFGPRLVIDISAYTDDLRSAFRLVRRPFRFPLPFRASTRSSGSTHVIPQYVLISEALRSTLIERSAIRQARSPRYLRAGLPVRATEQPYLILTIPSYVCNTSCSQYLSFKDHIHRTACSPQVPVVHFLPWKSFRHLHKVIWTPQRLISHEILLELCQLLRPGVRAGLNLLRQHPKSNPRWLLLHLKAYLLPRRLWTPRHPKLSLPQLVIRLPRSRYLQNAHHDRKDPLHFASCLSTTQTRLLLTPRGPPGGGETPQDHNRPLDPPQIKSSRSTSSCRSCRGVHLAWTIYTRCTSMPLLSSQGQPSRRSIQPFLLTFYCHLYPLECQRIE